MNSRRLRLVALAGLLLVAAAALVAHSLAFDFVTDDAFISFVYAKNLARHGQLVFNLGEHPVEGYTNFLWTLLLAGLLKLGLVPELTSRVLGTAFGVGTLGSCAWISRARARQRLVAVGRAAGAAARGRARLCLLVLGRSRDADVRLFHHARAPAVISRICSTGGCRANARRSLFGIAALTRPEGVLVIRALP